MIEKTFISVSGAFNPPIYRSHCSLIMMLYENKAALRYCEEFCLDSDFDIGIASVLCEADAEETESLSDIDIRPFNAEHRD